MRKTVMFVLLATAATQPILAQEGHGFRDLAGGGGQQARPAPAPSAPPPASRPSGGQGRGDGGARYHMPEARGEGPRMPSPPQSNPQQPAQARPAGEPQRDRAGMGFRDLARQNSEGRPDQRPQWNGDRRWDNDRRPDDRRDWNDRDRGNRDRDWQRDGRRNNGDNRWNGDRRPGASWDRGWRQDRRYDWRGWRDRNRQVFRAPRYSPPRGYGWGYRRWTPGYRLESFFWARQYWIADPWEYRLPPVDWPYRWVRYYNDVLLIDTTSGEVVDVIYDFFW